MYAVIRSGGKQHRVEPGQTLKVEKLDATVGDRVEFDQVLMVAADTGITVGNPLVASAKVGATVLGQDRAKKIIVFKKKQKKQYRRTSGHRQAYTELRVDDIDIKV